jgi:hypothetical protein
MKMMASLLRLSKSICISYQRKKKNIEFRDKGEMGVKAGGKV